LIYFHSIFHIYAFIDFIIDFRLFSPLFADIRFLSFSIFGHFLSDFVYSPLPFDIDFAAISSPFSFIFAIAIIISLFTPFSMPLFLID